MTKQQFRDFVELTKPRICMLSLMMATLGFLLAVPGVDFPMFKFIAMLSGLALVGAGCGAINQYLERDIDAMMWRTNKRPLPSGRMEPKTALLFGVVNSVLGLFALLFLVNSITMVLAAFTLFFYVAVYTPSKRVSSFSTLIGAIPGALPPLMGWTAAFGRISGEGLFLFAILFIWQIPHFLAIAWLYREDYARAGLPILSVVDEDGWMTAKQAVLYSVVLLPLTVLPSVWGIAGRAYLAGSTTLGVMFIAASLYLAVYRSKMYARRLFLASILYLPALGFLMIWDRI